MTVALADALRDYDGRHKDVLEQAARDVAPTAGALRQATRLLAGDELLLAQAASWVLLAWVQGGARPTRAVTAALVDALPRLSDKWVVLHVARCVPRLSLDTAQVEAACAFLTGAFGSRAPFVRAWALDGLFRLGLEHSEAELPARRALEAAQQDPAKSVQARLRNLLGRR